VRVNRFKGVEEADRFLLAEDDAALIGKDVSRPVCGRSAEEVAQRLTDRGCGGLVD